jgi:hypothetical protein
MDVLKLPEAPLKLPVLKLPVQSFVKFDIFGSFLGLAAQRGWAEGFFFIEKPTLVSGTEANRGT